jgi:hypothetical protein
MALLAAITATLLAGISIFVLRGMRRIEEISQRHDAVRWASAIVDSTDDAIISMNLAGENFQLALCRGADARLRASKNDRSSDPTDDPSGRRRNSTG